jgi:very-short-patch-repair endonuclease
MFPTSSSIYSYILWIIIIVYVLVKVFPIILWIIDFFSAPKDDEDQNNRYQSHESKPIQTGIFGKYKTAIYGNTCIMTYAESQFFRRLCEYVKDKDYLVCPKVRVEDVIGVRKQNGFRPWIVSSKLDRSHVDFILIGKSDLKTKFAIELDDTTHTSWYAKNHDKIKDEAFKCTSIPLLRFNNMEVSHDELKLKGIV